MWPRRARAVGGQRAGHAVALGAADQLEPSGGSCDPYGDDDRPGDDGVIAKDRAEGGTAEDSGEDAQREWKVAWAGEERHREPPSAASFSWWGSGCHGEVLEGGGGAGRPVQQIYP